MATPKATRSPVSPQHPRQKDSRRRDSRTFTPEEVQALREFHEGALRLFWEFGNITSALYACMIGLGTAELDGSKTFENFTTVQDTYSNALRTIILAMRAEGEKFDEAERELHHQVGFFADDLRSQATQSVGAAIRTLRYGLTEEKDGEGKN